MKKNPLYPLLDAVIVAVLIVALLLGTDVRTVVLIYLGLELVSHLANAATAALSDFIEGFGVGYRRSRS